MKALTVLNELFWGIFMFCIVLISGCAPYPQPTITGTLESTLPTDEKIVESYTPAFAVGIEKVYLGTIKPEGVIHPNFTTISPDGQKVVYAASRGKTKWYIIIENLKSHQFEKGPEFESVWVPTLSLDGTKVAYAAMQNGKWFIMMENKKGPEFDNVSIPVFSPDGGKIAYVAKQGGKDFVMVNDNKSPEFDWVGSLITFSPDSRMVAYAVKQGGRGFIISGSEKGPKFDAVQDPIFSPNGAKLAYIAAKDNKGFVVINGKKGPEHEGYIYDLTFSQDGRKLAYVTGGKTAGPKLVILEINNNNSLTLLDTYSLEISFSSLEPLNIGTITGMGWSPVFNSVGSKIAYGVNGGNVTPPIRTTPPGKHYFIDHIMAGSTIEIDGKTVAHINDLGLITPIKFSFDSKEISWIVINKDREIYLKKLKLK